MHTTKPKRRVSAGCIALAVVLSICAVTAVSLAAYRHISKPEPIEAHVLYKRPSWAWRECDTTLLEYGDDVVFQLKSTRYKTTCEHAIAWHLHDDKNVPTGTPVGTVTISLPNGNTIKERYYNAITPKDQTSCAIIDTSTTRYYVPLSIVSFN